MSNSLKETTLSTEIKYTGKVINVRLDKIVSSKNTIHEREVVEHSGGVVILPILEDNKIILIKQWRHPIGTELFELPAGKLEINEDPFLAAKRELEEETGFKSEELEYLGFIYTTPGFCNEKIYIYKASNLLKTQTNFDYGEIIENFIVDIKEAKAMIKNGKIVDAKTIIGINFLTEN